ncbi:hypothetical protein OG352_06125 [Streptomyces sp. NBC_01485]|uniref:hypothetical protein n=1 Tax=Streptomyces sp. NBC_01485 TaxID=2903884 RepID=UPI002E379191|nr:hypothetical protein [Streptomyces sp. NBC_01485]
MTHTTQPLTQQQLGDIAAIATRVADDPFYVSDCEGSLQVWREKALTHVRRDESGEIEMYSFPSTYKVTDQIVELDLSTWDPGEDEIDDKQRQDIHDLVEARAVLPALVAEVRRLQRQRKYLIAQLAKRDAEPGRGDTALREFLAGEETHVVADDSDGPEHVDDCPGCEAFTLTGHRAVVAGDGQQQ